MRRPTLVVILISALVLVVGYGAVAAYNHLPPFADDESMRADSDRQDTKEANTPTESKKSDKQPSQASREELALFYVAIDGGGVSGEKIGCNDSLVETKYEAAQTDDEVVAAMQALLAKDDQYVGESGLYNALYQSDLTFNRWEKAGGEVTVYLSGEIRTGGTCDDPRIIAQLERTAATAAEAETAKVLVNDQLIEDLLGGRGNGE